MISAAEVRQHTFIKPTGPSADLLHHPRSLWSRRPSYSRLVEATPKTSGPPDRTSAPQHHQAGERYQAEERRERVRRSRENAVEKPPKAGPRMQPPQRTRLPALT